MSSDQTTAPPKYQLPVTDAKTGQATKEWYRFLVNMRESMGPSPTSTDDSQLLAWWPESK